AARLGRLRRFFARRLALLHPALAYRTEVRVRRALAIAVRVAAPERGIGREAHVGRDLLQAALLARVGQPFARAVEAPVLEYLHRRRAAKLLKPALQSARADAAHLRELAQIQLRAQVLAHELFGALHMARRGVATAHQRIGAELLDDGLKNRKRD